MAKLVGPRGKVLAVDIQKEMLDIIRPRMEKNKVTNVEPIMGTIQDPKLPEGKVDLILMVDVYHEFSHPREMTEAMVLLAAARRQAGLRRVSAGGLRQGADLAGPQDDPEAGEGRDGPSTRSKHVKTIDDLPWQHILLFEKTAP